MTIQYSRGLELSLSEGDSIPDSGVSRWTFDDADTDSSTALDSWSDNDASINGATTGVSGASETYDTAEAYSFDGTDDYVDSSVTYGSDIEGAGAIAFWLNPDNSAGGASEHFFSGEDGAGENGIKLQNFDDGNSYWGISEGDTEYRFQLSDSFPSGWFHVVFTWDDTTGNYDLYWNGSEKGSASDLPSLSKPNCDLFIGAKNIDGSDTDHASCDIDDPRIYDKRLSSSEVSNLYNNGSING